MNTPKVDQKYVNELTMKVKQFSEADTYLMRPYQNQNNMLHMSKYIHQ